MWNDDASATYLQILQDHKDRVLMEVAGHDHFSSLRTHKESDDVFYHNLFVAPSITAWYNNNPGVSSFKISDELQPVELR